MGDQVHELRIRVRCWSHRGETGLVGLVKAGLVSTGPGCGALAVRMVVGIGQG